MSTPDFPVIISPNLGCPELISLEEAQDNRTKPLPLVIASGATGEVIPSKEFLESSLVIKPSASNITDRSNGESWPPEIHVYVEGDPVEIEAWNSLFAFEDAADTRRKINKILHHRVFGSGTHYWLAKISFSRKNGDLQGLLRHKGHQSLPTLYDIVISEGSRVGTSVNYHAIQCVDSCKKDINFIHVTDLHLAKRNDELLDEVLHAGRQTQSSIDPETLQKHYINFNDNFRAFIADANELADKGELDFVVITGDLVDFAFHWWEDAPNEEENNWKIFLNIITGNGEERDRRFTHKQGDVKHGNRGLKVAAFTSTGNHDWRTRPYDPCQFKQYEKFGLTKRAAENYLFRSHDPIRHKEKRAEMGKKLLDEHLENWHLGAFTDKLPEKVSKYITGELQKGLPWFLGIASVYAGLGAAESAVDWKIWFQWGSPAAGVLVGAATKAVIDYLMEKKAEFLLDNPLQADPMALYYYLRNINPYLDYAFKYGTHSFVVMDAGSDIFEAELEDRKTLSNVMRMSFDDNILGGSPDSRAFDSTRTYSDWGQIIWFEKVLEALNCGRKDSPEGEENGRTFVFVHAPPLNSRKRYQDVIHKLWESNRKSDMPKWIRKEQDETLTFGTINHYVSQFLYLCAGFLERELGEQDAPRRFNPVDIVFSGHAHWNVEFRIKKRGKDIQAYANPYSEMYEKGLLPDGSHYEGSGDTDLWEAHYRPTLIQTAACGLPGDASTKPPYFRKVTVNENGKITRFEVNNLDGAVSLDIKSA